MSLFVKMAGQKMISSKYGYYECYWKREPYQIKHERCEENPRGYHENK
jgi:hypothetical protein